MTTLEVRLNLPEGLAREAQAAGLLSGRALSLLVRDAVRRRSAQVLLAGAARATRLGRKPMAMSDIQSEVRAVRRARRARKRA